MSVKIFFENNGTSSMLFDDAIKVCIQPIHQLASQLTYAIFGIVPRVWGLKTICSILIPVGMLWLICDVLCSAVGEHRRARKCEGSLAAGSGVALATCWGISEAGSNSPSWNPAPRPSRSAFTVTNPHNQRAYSKLQIITFCMQHMSDE